MATKRWRGDAPKVAQVDSLTPANVGVGDIFIATMNGKTVTFTATAATVANVTAGLVAAWAASVIPEFLEITATDMTTYIKLTAKVAGRPFTVTASTTDGNASNTQTLTRAAVTANSGPNVVSLAANWEGAATPVDGDDVVFDQGNVDCLYDLDQNGITPASISVLPGYTGNIGLPPVNADNPNYPYFEYRETYLKYGNSGDATNIAVTIRGGGQRVKYSAGTSQATFRVDGSAQAQDANTPTVLLKGTHASTALHVSKGDVGFAFYAGETGQLVTINCGFQTAKANDSRIRLGSGVTLTAPAITMTGGRMEVNSAITSTSTVVVNDGEYKHLGTGGLAAGLAVRGGVCIYSSTGTLGGNPVVSGKGHLDFSQDLRTKTVTNPIDVYGNDAKVSDPAKVVSSLIIDLNEAENNQNISIGKNFRLTRGAVA